MAKNKPDPWAQRFRHKPVIVEAIQYRAAAFRDNRNLCDAWYVRYTADWRAYVQRKAAVRGDPTHQYLVDGAWLVRTANGHLGVVAQDAFEEQYEPVEAHPDEAGEDSGDDANPA